MNQKDDDWLYSSDTFQTFFKNSPRSLVIKANPPVFTVLAVSDTYLAITRKERKDILNRSLFDVFPGNLSDPSEKDSVYSSFMRVINTKETDVVPIFKYEIFVEKSGRMETEYWSNVNQPLVDKEGNVAYIINTTVNVTQQVQGQQALKEAIEQKQDSEKKQVSSDPRKVSNEELMATNAQLSNAQLSLVKTNEELKESVARRTQAFQESEARFKLIVEQAPIAIATFKGPQFVIELFNDKALSYWGRTAEEVRGIPLFTALPETSQQGFEELLTQVLVTGTRLVINELPVKIARDGQLDIAWVNFTYEPLKDEYGNVSGIIVVWTEVTEQVQARMNLERIIEEKTLLENTLRESRQRLQGILDTMAEGVGIIDITGKLVYANTMAQRIFGLTESQIKERSYNDPKWLNLRVDGSPLPENEHPMTIMMSTASAVYDYEIGVKAPEKDVFYISINAAPIFDAEGKLSGGIGTFMDVTNRRKLMDQKDEFISVASHELKTPLTALKASVQLLNNMKADASSTIAQRLISQVDASVSRLSMLVNDLLDVDRISRGQLMLRKRKFNVADMVMDCCQHIRSAGTHDITFQGDKDLATCADEQRISQVMINLVNNAVKYAPHSRRIIITVEKEDINVKVSVTDFGPGIPEERIPNLFDRYYRADYTIGQGGGLGLGLYISFQIIKNHNGDIGVKSEYGKGCTFWFTLPLQEDC